MLASIFHYMTKLNFFNSTQFFVLVIGGYDQYQTPEQSQLLILHLSLCNQVSFNPTNIPRVIVHSHILQHFLTYLLISKKGDKEIPILHKIVFGLINMATQYLSMRC